MKKMIAAVLALVMLLAMAGCSGSDSGNALIGTWQTEVDLSAIQDQMTEGMDAEIQSYFSFGELSYTMTVTFRDDGTYTAASDEASVRAAVDSLVASMEAGMMAALEAQFAATGVDMTVEEALAATGMTIGDLLTGVDAETIATEISSSFEGNYKAEDGKLFLSSSLETTVDEAIYDAYELDGDTLTLTEHFGAESEEAQLAAGEMYPMVFQRID